MSKQNDVEFTGEAIYNKNGIEVFYADNPRACIKYKGSIPYEWCIARNDSANMFYSYRFGSNEPAFYFVKDVEATQEELASIAKKGVINGTFENKYHFIVIQVPKYFDPNNNEIQQYTVTSANNDGEIPMSWNRIVEINPKLAVIKDVLKPKLLTKEEKAQYERFKNGISDNEFKKLSYEDKKSYLEIYPKPNKPITTNQFLLLPDDLKNLYVSYGIGLNDEQFENIKDNPKLVKRYAQISDRKLDAYLKGNYLDLEYSELIVLKGDRIAQYLDTLDTNRIKLFVLNNGIDKLEILQKYSSKNIVNGYSELKPIIYGLRKGNEEAIETLDEKLPNEVSVSYGDNTSEIRFKISGSIKLGDDFENAMSVLSQKNWEPVNIFTKPKQLDLIYEEIVSRAIQDINFSNILIKNGINPKTKDFIAFLEKFELTKPIKDYIYKLYNKTSSEEQIKKFNELHSKFTNIVNYKNDYDRYSRSINSEFTIKISNFIASFSLNSNILTTDKRNFEIAFKSLLNDLFIYDNGILNYDILIDYILINGLDPNYISLQKNVIKMIEDSVNKIFDNDKNLGESRYGGMLVLEETLKGLGKKMNTNKIENDFVIMELDRSKIKSDGSIYTTVTYKNNDNTYDGYLYITDIPTYFQNYKLFEAIKTFKNLIK
jgi:hypothetical protein